mgnify:FL=1
MQEVSGSIPLFSTKKALYFVGSTVLFFLFQQKDQGCTARHTGGPVTPPISTTADISPAGSTGVSVAAWGRADSARTSVAGFGRSASSKAMWAAKKFDSVLPNQRGSGGSSGQSGETVHKYLGKVDLKDTQQVEALKDSFCNSYANSKVENMMVITRNGEVHYMTDNNPRGVDCSYLGGKLKGSYNIHTHPPDTTQYSFSTDADIPAAFADGTRIMEAVDYKYRYRFVVPENITFEQWDRARSDVQDHALQYMAERGMSVADIEENELHVIIEETCKQLGVTGYSRWEVHK